MGFKSVLGGMVMDEMSKQDNDVGRFHLLSMLWVHVIVCSNALHVHCAVLMMCEVRY